MSKRFSTLDTTWLLFEHPKILFRMIERMDRNEAWYIRESDLVAEVMDYTRTLGSADRDQVRLALNTDNLFRSGLVIDIIKAEGERRLVFQDALINLMRACNASLYQELTDARLRGHLVTLRDVRNRLETSSFSDADPDYTELRDDLNERVSQLIGLLRQNVLRMQTISAQLADLSGDASQAPEKFLEFRQNLFEQIVTLYERHIKPTLVFLNPDTRLPDGSNLFETLEAMVRLLENHGDHSLADQLFRSSISLNALYKPIQAVAQEVEHFLRKTRQGMVQYNAMEHFYGKLQELKSETETLSLKRKWLEGGDFARSTGFLVGLRAQQRPKHYAFGESSSYYQLLFSELDLRLNDLRRRAEVPVLQQVDGSGRHTRIDVQRINQLYQWLETLELRPTSDLVRELHGRLDGFIPGYRFPDLLAALNRLVNSPPEGLQVVTTNRFRILDQSSDSEQFVYRKRRLENLEPTESTPRSIKKSNSMPDFSDAMDTTESADHSQASSSFEQILPAQSAAIYREFQAGRVIVRDVWDSNRSELRANPLYNLLYNHLSHFRTFYEHLGSELVFNETGAFFFLKESSDDESEEHDENAFRVQVILLLIGRYFARSGRDLEYLGRPDAGLNEQDLSALESDEEYQEILRAARFEKGVPEALDYLDKRHLLFRAGAGRCFLSSAGLYFLQELVREYEQG